MAKSVKFTNDTYLDGSNVRIPRIAHEQNLQGLFRFFSTSASGWDNQVKELEDYIDSQCIYGAYFINCNMNGAHVIALVERASDQYASFILFSYTYLQWYRKTQGVWHNSSPNIIPSIDTSTLIYQETFVSSQTDRMISYNFKDYKTYDLFIEGSNASPVDYSVLPNSGWYTFVMDRTGGSTGNHYYESLNTYLQFRLDADFSVHYVFRKLPSGRIAVHGDWVNRTSNGGLYSRHINGVSNDVFTDWTSLYLAGTFPAGMRIRIYERE